MLKTAAFGLGFQRLPRDLANVNALKTMFDPYIRKASPSCLMSTYNICFCGEIRKILTGLMVAQLYARLTGGQEVAGLTPTGSAKFLRGDLS